MLKATRYVEHNLRERLRQGFDMRLPRFDVLAALTAAPEGLRMTELSQQLMISNGNVTGIVDAWLPTAGRARDDRDRPLRLLRAHHRLG
ncbi:hypothetical protein [Paracoccus rhizosphaerae]|uniref:MarR family protein n=1 Tax=Paracoccus rhizosphaerae TaxID=1133347 RepID=A0ABV6CF80_9RHOB|nr:hypothetical protein [Paracoccus rhizosphaerae]